MQEKLTNFDVKSMTKQHLKDVLEDLKSGKKTYDDLDEKEKEYIRLHDPTYKKMFL